MPPVTPKTWRGRIRGSGKKSAEILDAELASRVKGRSPSAQNSHSIREKEIRFQIRLP
jgi:hypothetical protein